MSELKDAESSSGKRPQFGSRHLKNPDDVFQHNAWDNVEWDAEIEAAAKQKVEENSAVKASDTDQVKYETQADKMWDSFYGIHQNRFFKDRQWIFTEFPEVAPGFESSYESVHVQQQQPSSASNLKKDVKILEVGCGVGNTVFPILKTNNHPDLRVYACDFSSTAIELVKQHPEYDTKRCAAFVCDITSDAWAEAPFLANSLDIAILVFVLSAVKPEKMKTVAQHLYNYLAPGGIVLFRDYGRYDLAQLRFKQGRCISDNFYARGDGTMVYFFTQDDVRNLFTSVGFVEEQNIVDRRLQVNRGKMLTMYRVWIQGKFRKPICT